MASTAGVPVITSFTTTTDIVGCEHCFPWDVCDMLNFRCFSKIRLAVYATTGGIGLMVITIALMVCVICISSCLRSRSIKNETNDPDGKSVNQESEPVEENTDDYYVDDLEDDKDDANKDLGENDIVVLNDETPDHAVDVPDEEEVVLKEEEHTPGDDTKEKTGDNGRNNEGEIQRTGVMHGPSKEEPISIESKDKENLPVGETSVTESDDIVIEMPAGQDEILVTISEKDNDTAGKETSGEADDKEHTRLHNYADNSRSCPEIIVTHPDEISPKSREGDWETFGRPDEPLPDYEDAGSRLETDDVSLVSSMEGDPSFARDPPEQPAVPRIRSMFTRALSLRMVENMASRLAKAANESKQESMSDVMPSDMTETIFAKTNGVNHNSKLMFDSSDDFFPRLADVDVEKDYRIRRPMVRYTSNELV